METKNIEICRYIQSNIDKLCQIEIDEIFKILYKNNSTYTQNNNGIFVNLNWIDDEILIQIYNYINFCLTSQSEINKYEIMKNLITDSMTKDKIDDKTLSNTNTSNLINTNIIKSTKISSSMKFYLLKKKFQKQQLATNIESYLTHDECLIDNY